MSPPPNTPHPSASDIHIRSVKVKDIPALLGLVRELAEYEHLSHQVTATEDDYQRSLFGPNPAARALVAEDGTQNALVGYAIYFPNFSTFLGRAGIWLEDLYVQPAYRGRGVGKYLLESVKKIAEENKVGRLEWCVLDWNQSAIDFYEKIGAKVLPDWRIVRHSMEGE